MVAPETGSRRRVARPRRRGATLTVPLAAALLAAGCTTVGPDYRRPAQPLPERFTEASAPATQPTIIEVEWWRRFNDPTLDALVGKALDYNTDVVGAMARIDEADAMYAQARGNSMPRLDLQAGGQRARQQYPLSPTGFATYNGLSTSLAASYELDFWGKMRRTREAARAGAVGSRFAADVTRISVAAGVCQAYINLRSLDEQIRLAERTVKARDEQLELIDFQFKGGTASALDYQQARGLRSDAMVQLRELERQRGIAQNQLALLTGEPGALLALEGSDDPLSRLPVPPLVPPGLPSSLLERRPDIQLAEQNLVAANAQIGIAKAAMLPTISLTAGLGGVSRTLADLFDASNRIWDIGFGLALPLFRGGALAAQTAQAEAQKRQLVSAYQGAVQSAFKDVSDALISGQAAQISEVDVKIRADAARDAAALARDRYESGYSAYLELLDADRTLYAAQQQVILNRQARLSAAIDLYRSMAGGWPDSADATVAGAIDQVNDEAGVGGAAVALPGSTASVPAGPGPGTAAATRAVGTPGQKRGLERSQSPLGRLPEQQRRMMSTGAGRPAPGAAPAAVPAPAHPPARYLAPAAPSGQQVPAQPSVQTPTGR